MPTSDSATQVTTTPATPTLDPNFTKLEISDAPGSATDLAAFIDKFNEVQDQLVAATNEITALRDSLSRTSGFDIVTVSDDGSLVLVFKSKGQTYSFGIKTTGALVLYNQTTGKDVKLWQ